MDSVNLVLAIVLPISISIISAILSRILFNNHKIGKEFLPYFESVYLCLLDKIYDLEKEKFLITKITKDKALNFIKRFVFIKQIYFGIRIRSSSKDEGKATFQLICKAIRKRTIESSIKLKMDITENLLLFYLMENKALPEKFYISYKNEYIKHRIKMETLQQLDERQIQKLYRKHINKSSKKISKIELKKIVFLKEETKESKMDLVNQALTRVIRHVHKLMKTLKIDLKPYIKYITNEELSVIFLQYKIHLPESREIFIEGLKKNEFSKFRPFAHTWVKIVENAEINQYKKIEEWFKAKFGNLIKKAKSEGEAKILLFKFLLRDKFEGNFGFENEKHILTDVIELQLRENSHLSEKYVLSKNIEMKYPSLNPSNFLMKPLPFINCILEKDIKEDEFSNIQKKYKFVLNNTLDFDEIKKDLIKESFSLSEQEYKMLKKAIETIDLITSDLPELIYKI